MTEVAVPGFRRTPTGRIVARFDADERALLVTLVSQLAEFIEPDTSQDGMDPLARLVGIDVYAVRPEDPAMIRLLPDAYPEDAEASAEFRRYTERGLREAKLAHAATTLQTLARPGDKVTLSVPEMQAWVGTLNDLRLALGTRLGVSEEGMEYPDAMFDPADPDAVAWHIYSWLSYLQQTLVDLMLDSLTGRGPSRRETD